MHKKAINYINKYFKGNLENKTIIITGGNAGIGLESARYCLYLKMNVILAVRSLSRGEKALENLRKDFPQGKVSLMELDVSEEKSIINFVNKIKEEKIDINVFYHNAGVYNLPFTLKEGRELVISTNFYGPLMINSLLLPYLYSLNHEVKMIVTSSIAATWTKIKIDYLVPNEELGKMKIYSNSKLLDAYLFDYLLRNDNKNVKYFLIHPGVTGTSLFSKAFKSKLFIKIVNTFMKIFANPLYKSSLSIVNVMSNEADNGEFYGPSHFFHALGYPKRNDFIKKHLIDVDYIIEKSEKVVGYKLIK